MGTLSILSLSLLFLVVALQSCGAKDFSLLTSKIRREEVLERRNSDSIAAQSSESVTFAAELPPVFIGCQDGLKEKDKIECLPGQPEGVNFDHYSGYVTVDPNAGRALFYYFVESPESSSSKPLVLWLNHTQVLFVLQLGMEHLLNLGHLESEKMARLYQNPYAWNREANIIFLESHPGAGFSYSNTSSNYRNNTELSTARDTYIFLINWLERFPEYKTSDFFIAGERFAGHFAPQLARLILQYNNRGNYTIVNLKRIIIGNPLIDNESFQSGSIDYFLSHALISDEIYTGIKSNCNFSSTTPVSDACNRYWEEFSKVTENVYLYDIYAPLCNVTSASNSISAFDPCAPDYVFNYLNNPQVQIALHLDVATIPFHWELCNYTLRQHYWAVDPLSELPVMTELMERGLQIWLYSGDTDGYVTVTSTKYAIDKLRLSVKTRWYPWSLQNEVGGFVVEYQNLTFVTVRGAGELVPSYQPARALALFSSFITGSLPPSS